MPRRPPARLRFREPDYVQAKPPHAQVPRVSSSALRAIAQYERAHLYLGGIAEALAAWNRFVHASYRQLDRHTEHGDDDGPTDDPEVARIRLGWALNGLPRKAARELRAQVRPLDERYLARSIPAPEVAHLRALL
ncbi:hypothetical protein [Amycolatopsis sp. WGS_07]|uniref:hypothetical protein n=1 Tax=Amycolatopsis sp. WGS_07 TaxID=3076764 RepID=UPI0038735756